MKETIDQIRDDVKRALGMVDSSRGVEELKIRYLGKKGAIQELMQGLRHASPEERPVLGKLINDLKVEVSCSLEDVLASLAEREESVRLASETVDVTLPGRRRWKGRRHLIKSTLDRAIDVLCDMGFSVQTGPDIDSDYNNFEALNFPPNHPARDMQDTFYITDELLLRTHMTVLQPRVMQQQQPPLRVIAPGKCYRNEAVSARSHVFFHQIDGFYVDKGVSFSDLMGTLDQFLQKFFSKDVKWRYRPSYFPFVEPGLEADVGCLCCEGKGCVICKHTGWLEILGAGMIHPEVLKNGGIDPEEYSGFAWGMGLDRLVILLHGIDDIRRFTENDMGFLEQFV